MTIRSTIAIAAAALLSGAVVASAATMAPKASDTLNLTSTQQKTAWRDLNTPSLNQNGPADFTAKVGAVLPSDITAATMPSKAARDVPALRPYDFAMVNRKVVIVNPSDKTIAGVISG
jgi:hypothetical protein